MALLSERFRDSPRQVLLGAVAVLIVIGLVATALVTTTSLLLRANAEPEPVEEEGPPPVVTANWQDTPANAVLTETLGNPPEGWGKAGEPATGADAPAPFTCAKDGQVPALSLSASYNVDDKPLMVTAQAYPAGQGGKAIQTAIQSAPECQGGGGSVSDVDDVPGQDARQGSFNRANLSSNSVTWRRGDVVMFISTTRGQDLQKAAREIDAVLEPKLSPVCKTQDSSPDDATRNPYLPGYAPYTVGSEVTVPPVETPSQVASRKVPGKDLIDRAAEPREVPEWPVWPRMPTVVEQPKLPDAPSATPPTEKVVQVPSTDPDGPGCGWAFTGMKPPRFDEETIDRQRDELEAKGTRELETEAKAWQTALVDYWKNYDAYEKKVPAYLTYRANVDKVNQAWDAIAAQWDDYRARQAERENAIRARDAFINAKRAAQADYDRAVQRCNAPEPPRPAPRPAPSPSGSPSPTQSPSPSPSPSAPPRSTPPSPAPDRDNDSDDGQDSNASSFGSLRIETVRFPTNREGCPADRPAILDQDPPGVPPVPAPPPDPRPVGERN